jgi:hypothetical protein
MAYSALSLLGLDLAIPATAGVMLLQAVFFILGVVVMIAFMRTAQRVEPFTTGS